MAGSGRWRARGCTRAPLHPAPASTCQRGAQHCAIAARRRRRPACGHLPAQAGRRALPAGLSRPRLPAIPEPHPRCLHQPGGCHARASMTRGIAASNARVPRFPRVPGSAGEGDSTCGPACAKGEALLPACCASCSARPLLLRRPSCHPYLLSHLLTVVTTMCQCGFSCSGSVLECALHVLHEQMTYVWMLVKRGNASMFRRRQLQNKREKQSREMKTGALNRAGYAGAGAAGRRGALGGGGAGVVMCCRQPGRAVGVGRKCSS